MAFSPADSPVLPASGDPIDLVYTWVDGENPDYVAFRNRYASIDRQLDPERFRDSVETLRYSMRSVAQHLPWVRSIILVTQRPQRPAWLDLSHPKIRLVHHDEIFEHERHLPCFNSNPIESHLHRIPGLSRAFIYMNDDHLLLNPVSRGDFFAPDGRVRIFGTLAGENFPWRRYEVKNEFIGIGFTDHIPMLILKDRWAEGLTVWPELTEKTRCNRFREPDDLCIHRAYRYVMLKRHRDEGRAERFWEVLEKSIFHKMKPGLEQQQQAFARISASRARFLCLNDDLGPEPDQAVLKLVRQFLAGRYPQPSPWEKSG